MTVALFPETVPRPNMQRIAAIESKFFTVKNACSTNRQRE
jgi:hypothetical protein